MSDVAAVAAELAADDVVIDGAPLRPLSGGVSSDVWRVAATDMAPRLRNASPFGLIVKRPLARLRVPDRWESSVDRGPAEATALEYLAGITPGAIPALLWRRDDLPALAVESAPLDWRDWRDQLSTCDADDDLLDPGRVALIARRLGEVISTWHVRSTDVESVPLVLRGGDRLQSLRTNPFHRAVAAGIPGLREELIELADELEGARTCLVHGDVSPKNVLVAPAEGLWVIDAETAHVGHPALDVAFLSAHLLLKAVWRARLRSRLDSARREFEAAYRTTSRLVSPRTWNRQTGAILAARVRGLSRVGYLDQDAQRWVLEQATLLIRDESGLDDVWNELRAA